MVTVNTGACCEVCSSSIQYSVIFSHSFFAIEYEYFMNIILFIIFIGCLYTSTVVRATDFLVSTYGAIPSDGKMDTQVCLLPLSSTLSPPSHLDLLIPFIPFIPSHPHHPFPYLVLTFLHSFIRIYTYIVKGINAALNAASKVPNSRVVFHSGLFTSPLTILFVYLF